MSTPRNPDLAAVDFGGYAAEGDRRILDYFLETGTTKKAAEGTQLVIGRKGSGKTALFRHLSAKLDTRVVELDLSEYVFGAHAGLKEAGIPDAFAYSTSWRLVIAVAMFAEMKNDLGFWDRRKGKRILRRIGFGSNSGAFSSMVEWLTRVRKLDLPSVAGIASIGGLELAEDSGGLVDIRTIQLLDELEGLLLKASRKRGVSVLIDRLDDAWNGSEESLRLIIGAIRASRHFSALFKQAGPAPVIVFLRSDLWEALNFNDKNKAGQSTIYLDWRDEELAQIIDLRIKKSTGDEEQGWGTVFTAEAMRQRAGAQTYILKRTLGRPRDVVAFASFALEGALREGNSRIEKSDIYNAETRYSKHALDELRDEIADHVAAFPKVVDALKRIGRRTFTSAEWYAATSAAGLDRQEGKVALDQLFDASAVGVLRAGGSSGGSGTRYKYQDRFLGSLEGASLQVHLAFVRELGLTDR